MAITYQGIPPTDYWRQERSRLARIINSALLTLEAELVAKSPVGVSAQLKGGWTFLPLTEQSNSATLGQSQNYFLAVELGRKPGSGISLKGKESVILWARRVLGLDTKQATNLAYGLSKKYRRQGRPAQGFAGLAIPGSIPTQLSEQLNPISGGLIDLAFRELDRRLS